MEKSNMYLKLISTVMAASALTGCVSMFTHLRFDDSTIQKQASILAVTMSCAEKELLPESDAYAFAHALGDLHSVSVFNRDAYESKYRAVRSDLSSRPAFDIARLCQEAQNQLPSATSMTRQKYAEIAQSRRDDMAAFSRSMANTGSSFNTRSMYMPMPSNQANFNAQPLSGQQPRHFLVNTGSSMRQCTVTDGGYVTCH